MPVPEIVRFARYLPNPEIPRCAKRSREERFFVLVRGALGLEESVEERILVFEISQEEPASSSRFFDGDLSRMALSSEHVAFDDFRKRDEEFVGKEKIPDGSVFVQVFFERVPVVEQALAVADGFEKPVQASDRENVAFGNDEMDGFFHRVVHAEYDRAALDGVFAELRGDVGFHERVQEFGVRADDRKSVPGAGALDVVEGDFRVDEVAHGIARGVHEEQVAEIRVDAVVGYFLHVFSHEVRTDVFGHFSGAAFGDLEGFLAPLAGHPGRGDAELTAELFVFGFEEFEFGLRHGEGAVIGFFTGSDSGFQASDSAGYGHPAGLAPN